MERNYMALEVFSVIITIILIYACFNEGRKIGYRRGMNIRQYNQHFRNCLICHLITLAADIPLWKLSFTGQTLKTVEILICVSFCAMMFTIYFFTCYLVKDLNDKTYVSEDLTLFSLFLSITACVVWIWGINAGVFVSLEEGAISYTRFYPAGLIGAAILVLFNLVLVISCRKVLGKGELFAYSLIGVMALAEMAFAMSLNQAVSIVCTTVSLLLIYVIIHSEHMATYAVKDAELTDAKVKLMVSQIQPHFMYNSLNSIYYLIDKDSEKAKEAVSSFSDYLRGNINAIKMSAPVFFDFELEQVQNYIKLEQMRFDEEVNIVYDIKVKNFMIPPITVQPLVENAVKHGITQKKGGGTILIRTEETATAYIVIIRDNGVGFNIGETTGDGTHVGIDNVRFRLESMVKGELRIRSTKGVGTECRIRIPKRTQGMH